MSSSNGQLARGDGRQEKRTLAKETRVGLNSTEFRAEGEVTNEAGTCGKQC